MHDRHGFTLIEMAFVLMIGAILVGMGGRQYSQLANERAVGNARDALILTAYRARAEAMRSGGLVHMRVRPDSGLVRVSTTAGELLHTLDADDYGARMVGGTMSVCYTARGYALPGCTSFGDSRAVGFARGADTAAVVVLPLGQLRRVE